MKLNFSASRDILKFRMRVVLFIAVLFTTPAFAGKIYSYVDENGVKIFTNEPSHHDPVAEKETTLKTQPSAKRTLDQRSGDFLPIIRNASEKYGVHEDLIKAVIAVESNFDPRAVSSKSCKGLMQLHPDTARRFGVRDIFDPGQNIEGGTRYLQFLMNYFDRDMERVLAAYNAGENAVKRYAGIPPYPETQKYVKKVGTLYDFSILDEEEVQPIARVSRVRRMVLSDGAVVFTNTPTEITN